MGTVRVGCHPILSPTGVKFQLIASMRAPNMVIYMQNILYAKLFCPTHSGALQLGYSLTPLRPPPVAAECGDGAVHVHRELISPRYTSIVREMYKYIYF